MPTISEETIAAATRAHLPGVPADAPVAASALPGGGSDRTYWRIKIQDGDRTRVAIFMHYTTARADNLAFVHTAGILDRAGIAIPKIFAHKPEDGFMWIEDLGTIHLWDYRNDPWDVRRPLYEATLREVGKIHAINETDLSEPDAHGLQPAFDEALYLWEQDYFFEQFLYRFSALPAHEVTTLREKPVFKDIRTRLAAQPRQLLHRDFQSQNVLIRDGDPVIIDFQGLRPGRPEYDIASLLYDPYVPLAKEERAHLSDFYLQNAAPEGTDPSTYTKNLADCATQRLMQALGAYGNLAANVGKPEFLKHIPAACENIRQLAPQSDLAKALDPKSLHLDRP